MTSTREGREYTSSNDVESCSEDLAGPKERFKVFAVVQCGLIELDRPRKCNRHPKGWDARTSKYHAGGTLMQDLCFAAEECGTEIINKAGECDVLMPGCWHELLARDNQWHDHGAKDWKCQQSWLSHRLPHAIQG